MLHTTSRSRITTLALLGLSLAMAWSTDLGASTTIGPDWDGDSKEDAGSKPATAQKVEKDDSSSVMIIRGELKGEENQEEEESEGLASVGDYQDM